MVAAARGELKKLNEIDHRLQDRAALSLPREQGVTRQDPGDCRDARERMTQPFAEDD